MNSSLLAENINTYLGGLLILAFGLLILVLGFKAQGMINPIAEALALQEQNALVN